MFPETIKPILIEFGCEDCGVSGVVSYGGGLRYLGVDEVIEFLEGCHNQEAPHCVGELEIMMPIEILMNEDPYAEYSVRHVN